MTANLYSMRQKKLFSASHAAGIDEVDWRVPRLMACKDPKYNSDMPPAMAMEVQSRKYQDGMDIENALANESYAIFAKKLADEGYKPPPPPEIVYQRGVEFEEAVPNYEKEADLHHRRLVLRPLDQVMAGDVSEPLPIPQLFPEESESFREGKYVKDDCPMS